MYTGSASTPGPFVHGPLRPRKFWFWFGGLMIFAAVVGAVFWFVNGFLNLIDAVDDLERVPFDRGGTAVLDEAGGYVVYAEGDNVSVFPGLRIVVTGPGGEPVRTAAYGGSLTYNFGGHNGTAVATFDAPVPGTYEVAVAEGGSGFAEELAVGPSFAGDLVRTLVGGFVIGGVGVLLGVATIVVTAVRRSRAKRRRQPGSPPPTSWRPPPPTNWQPPPPTVSPG